MGDTRHPDEPSHEEYLAYEAPDPPADMAEAVLAAVTPRTGAPSDGELPGLPALERGPGQRPRPRGRRWLAVAVGAAMLAAGAAYVVWTLTKAPPAGTPRAPAVVKTTPVQAPARPPMKKKATKVASEQKPLPVRAPVPVRKVAPRKAAHEVEGPSDLIISTE